MIMHQVECEARCTGKTGVEMEAMVGASVAALAVYDMCKGTCSCMTSTFFFLW